MAAINLQVSLISAKKYLFKDLQIKIFSSTVVILYTLIFFDWYFWENLTQEIYFKNLTEFAMDDVIVMVVFCIVFIEVGIVT